jgi:hypothetical protein
MAARQAQIDDLNRSLRPGHNRAKARTQREAFPTFKESVLKQATAEQPF